MRTLMNKGKYEGEFHIYCHYVVRDMLLAMTKMTLKKKDFARVGTSIFLHEVKDGTVVNFEGLQLTAFDILSAMSCASLTTCASPA